jgi:hypothetical protein
MSFAIPAGVELEDALAVFDPEAAQAFQPPAPEHAPPDDEPKRRAPAARLTKPEG